MEQFNMVKVIERGTWRSIGQRVTGISPFDIPIGGMSGQAILQHVGGTAYRVGKVQPRNAFVIDRPPLRLLYVRPGYSGYRRNAAVQVFPKTNWPVHFDHALGRKIAETLGLHYLLLIRVVPNVNSGHGAFEKAAPVVGSQLHGLCFADRRILDKWIGRPPKHFNDPDRLGPYRLDRRDDLGLTLKQAGKWGFAMGVEDDPWPLLTWSPLDLK